MPAEIDAAKPVPETVMEAPGSPDVGVYTMAEAAFVSNIIAETTRSAMEDRRREVHTFLFVLIHLPHPTLPIRLNPICIYCWGC